MREEDRRPRVNHADAASIDGQDWKILPNGRELNLAADPASIIRSAREC
jgi:hypothetical protein